MLYSSSSLSAIAEARAVLATGIVRALCSKAFAARGLAINVAPLSAVNGQRPMARARHAPTGDTAGAPPAQPVAKQEPVA